MSSLDPFRPATDGPTALFLDTSGLFAYFHPGTAEHEEARTFLTAVGNNEIPYRPLFASTYVIDELATLLLTNGTHERARTALDRTVDSGAITVLGETDERFAETRTAFEQYDDHAISFTDRMNAVQMRERDVDHVFAYDGDFETLGFERIPRA